MNQTPDTVQPPMRERVERLQAMMEGFPQADCPVRHVFAPGIYLREMLVPADVYACGAVHKTEHITIVVGHCWLTTDDGLQEFMGYNSFVSKPGIKRAIYAVQPTMVTTVHLNPTNERDLDKLTPMLVEAEARELLGGAENRQRLANEQQAKEALP